MSHVQSTAIELANLLDDSLAPVYVLDEERRIIYCNPALARWTGVAAGELLSKQCIYHSLSQDGSPAAVAAGLCPPPKVFCGQPQSSVVSCQGRDGEPIHRRGHFLPLSNGEDESAAVVAVLESSDCSPDEQDAAGEAEAQLHAQLLGFRRQMAARYRIEGLVGNSPAMVRARAQIDIAAKSGAGVLVLGPRGSGKDFAAKAIHYSATQYGSMVPLDCAVLEANLLRSTLRALWSRSAGAKGAPTTLLLSDADCLPPEAQTDLAELLGGDARRVRLIATATRPLGEIAAEGRFSPALACLLTTITIQLPALVERLEDLPLVAQAFLEEANGKGTKQVGGFTSEALDRLAVHRWPGNLDELAAVVRESHERANGGEVAARDLPKQIQWASQAAAHPPRADEAIVLEAFLEGVEKEVIARAMRRAKNNKSKAAKLLGLSRPRLYRRLIQLGLEQPDD